MAKFDQGLSRDGCGPRARETPAPQGHRAGLAAAGGWVGRLVFVLVGAVTTIVVLGSGGFVVGQRWAWLGFAALLVVAIAVAVVALLQARPTGDRQLVEVGLDLAGSQPSTRPGADPGEKRRRIEAVLGDSSAPTIVYQPIVETSTGGLVGAEALSRFASEPYRTPDVWFAEANEVGRGEELELRAIRRSIDGLAQIPSGYLSLNISANTFMAPAFAELISDCSSFSDRLVFEITEHESIERYDLLVGVVDLLKSLGVRIAVDDAGAGYASFAHILELRPDVIKLDRSVISGLHEDPVRRALVAAMADFAVDIGASVVAEGVELIEELRTLRAIGISHAQGDLLGRPGPLPLSPTAGLLEAPLTALIVDDDAVVRMIVSKVVRRAGFVIVGQADNGNQAIDLASITNPDVIVLDLDMPILSGGDALPSLREDHPTTHIVVLSHNTHQQGDTRERVLALGADDFVLKDDATTSLPEVLKILSVARSRSGVDRSATTSLL